MNRIPKGCDQQGRHPQAAESCTELGEQDEELVDRWSSAVMDILIALAVLAAIGGVITIAMKLW